MRTTTDSFHVLHVDDEPELASLTADFLKREDERFIVDTATSASEGLDKLADIEYDCIVSYYQMPKQNLFKAKLVLQIMGHFPAGGADGPGDRR